MARQFTNNTSDKVGWTLALPALTNITLLVRIYQDSAGSYRGLFCTDVLSGGGNFVNMISSGAVNNPLGYMWGTAGADEYDIAGPAINSGEWTACALAVQASRADLYTGTQAGPQRTASNVKAHESITPSSAWCLGKEEQDNTRTFAGRECEAAIYNDTLTAAEILGFQRGYSPSQIRPANLVFYAPLLNSYAYDIIGGLSLTVTGTTLATHSPVTYPKRRFSMKGTAASVPPVVFGYQTSRLPLLGVG